MKNYLISHPVLVVDDVDMTRLIIGNMLQAHGFKELYEAKSGQEALQILNSNDIGLVICDFSMPGGMSGVDLLNAMRTDSALKNIPFLVISARGDDESIFEAKACGADGWLRKPVDYDELTHKIRSIQVNRQRPDGLSPRNNPDDC
jgi:CheY-like chemotaxis protein